MGDDQTISIQLTDINIAKYNLQVKFRIATHSGKDIETQNIFVYRNITSML